VANKRVHNDDDQAWSSPDSSVGFAVMGKSKSRFDIAIESVTTIRYDY